MNWGTITMWEWKAVTGKTLCLRILGGLLVLAGGAAAFSEEGRGLVPERSKAPPSLVREGDAPGQQVTYGEDEARTLPPLNEKEERGPASTRKRPVRKFQIKKQRRSVPKARIPVRRIRRQMIEAAQPPRQLRRFFEAGTDEAELESVINQEIRQLFNLLKTTNRRDLRLRLGSLYVEKARFIEYRIYEKYDQQMERFQQKKSKIRPRLSLRPTFVYIDKATSLFETYRKQYPNDKNMDQVLFFLGMSYFKKGQSSLGRTHYETLVKKYPKSEYTNDVYFELGEYYFARSRWERAAGYYTRITRRPSLRLYPFALYKLAWCRFKQNRVPQAMAHLEDVVSDGARSRQSRNKKQVRIHFAREALNDLVLFFSHSRRRPTEALPYFENLSGSRSRSLKMLKSLAYAYLDQGRLSGLTVTFKQLIEETPFSPLAYEYQSQIVRAYTYSGPREVFLRELRFWLSQYGPKSAWASHNRRQPDLIKKATELMKSTVRSYALQMHQSFRKTKDPKAKNQALMAYSLYNEYFKESDEMRFFYAELLFDLNRYGPASRQYLYVVENFKKSKWYEASSLNSVLTLEKILPSSKRIRQLVGKSTQPVEFPESVRLFHRQAAHYMSSFPAKANVPAILYKSASLNYEFNHHGAALKQFWMLIEKYPQSRYTEYSANLILDIHNLKKDFEGLREAARRLLQNRVIARSGSAAGMRKILSQISLRTAERLARENQFLKSAEMYKSFADSHPRSPLRTVAYYNAGVNFKKSGDSLKALSLYKRVLKSPRGAEEGKNLRTSLRREIPLLYQKTGQYAGAARAFGDYARAFPSDSVSVDFWYNAALIYDGFNNTSRALPAYLEYLKKSRKPDRYQTLFLVGEMFRRTGRSRQALTYYTRFLNQAPPRSPNLTEAAFYIAEIKKARGQVSESKKWYRRATAVYRRSGQGVFFAAQSQFHLVYDTYGELKRVRIPRQAAGQQAAMQKKLRLFNKLKNDLKQVLRYDSGEQVVASLTLIGLAAEHLGDAIYFSPVPKGLNRAEVQQYREGLKKTAAPFKKDAISNYEQALARARKLKTPNREWQARAQERLAHFGKSPLHKKKILRKKVFEVLLDTEDVAVVDPGDPVKLPEKKLASEDPLKYRRLLVQKWLQQLEGMGRKSENLQRVVSLVSRILNFDPENVQALNTLGVVYMDRGQTYMARILFARGLKKDPQNSLLQANMGLAYLREEKLQDAQVAFLKSLRSGGGTPAAAASLGSFYIQAYEYEAALDYLGSAYRSLKKTLSPTDPRWIRTGNNYAVALAWSGSLRRAASVFKDITSREGFQEVDILLNYAILLGMDLKKTGKGLKILKRADLMNRTGAYTARLKAIQKVLQERES